MRILCLVDIDDYKDKNSFPIDFVNSLKANQSVDSIDYGTKWLSEDSSHWDIVHIHWPENLLKGRIISKTNIESLNKKLKSWGRKSYIICTIHNGRSHYNNSGSLRLLYECVFSNCAGFIHMGQKSESIFNKIFKNQFSSVPYAIIPHGNYSSLGRSVAVAQARTRLGFDEESRIILVIGKLRHKEEIKLMLKSFTSIVEKNYYLVFLGTFPSSRSYLKNYNFSGFFKSFFDKLYWRYLLLTTENVVFNIGFHKASTLLDFLSACDILFIPRRHILNSGNVPLGFSFSKVVVGPDSGNTGELLRRNNNPVFLPEDSPTEIGDKLKSGILLSSTILGSLNKSIADEEWEWDKIATRHIEFYNSILKKPVF